MKKSNKKGFTIVELVIVIAVVAILAAVLIPTFVNVVKKANVSNDTALVRNLNSALIAEEASGNTPKTMQDVVDIAEDYGYNVSNLQTKADGYKLLWHQQTNRFYVQNGDKITTNPEVTSAPPADGYLYWEIAENVSDTHSVYLKNYTSNTVNTSKGVDLGNCTGITAVNYSNTGTQDKVIIRTNSYETNLTVDAANDTVKHYDMLGNLVIEKIKSNSYHEFGKVKNVTVKSGRFVAEAGSEISGTVTTEEGAIAETENSVIWGAPTYVWAEDYSTCTATRTDSKNEKNETETVTAVRTEENGTITYTATFENAAFGVQTKIVTAEEILVDEMNNAVNGYTGESIMKALVYMSGKGKAVTVEDLVHSDVSKTFAYDTAAHKFYVVSTVDGTVCYPENATKSGDLVYVVNSENTISANMMRIYFNDFSAKDYAIRKADVSVVKSSLESAEIGGNVKYIYTELAKAYKAENSEKSFEEQAALQYGAFDSGLACFKDFTKLQSTYIGNNVKYIGRDAFLGCKSLNYIYYNSATENMIYLYSDPNSVKDTPFENTNSQKIDLVFGKDVKVISCLFGSDRTDGKNVKSILFEEGIKYTKIGYYAFNGMQCLTEIILPSNCKIIEGTSSNGAFANTKISKIIWSGTSTTVNDVLYEKDRALGHGNPVELARYFGYEGKYGVPGVVSLYVGDYEYVPENCTKYSGTIKVYKNGELQYTATLSNGEWTKS